MWALEILNHLPACLKTASTDIEELFWKSHKGWGEKNK